VGYEKIMVVRKDGGKWNSMMFLVDNEKVLVVEWVLV